MNKPSAIVFAASAALLLGLTGCTGVASVNESPASPVESADDPANEPAAPTTPVFGNEYVYDDGVAITVAAPVPFTPGPYAAGVEQANNLMFTLTIRNGSDKPLEPYAFPTVSSASVEGTNIVDMDASIGLGPTTVILPGNSIQWNVGYSVADPANLTFQVSPGFEYANVVFTN
jgi:hypothetical protein